MHTYRTGDYSGGTCMPDLGGLVPGGGRWANVPVSSAYVRRSFVMYSYMYNVFRIRLWYWAGRACRLGRGTGGTGAIILTGRWRETHTRVRTLRLRTSRGDVHGHRRSCPGHCAVPPPRLSIHPPVNALPIGNVVRFPKCNPHHPNNAYMIYVRGTLYAYG